MSTPHFAKSPILSGSRTSESVSVRRELALSDRKFIHIARECGFKNAAVLKNLFRKAYGMSMRDYRKRHGGATEP